MSFNDWYDGLSDAEKEGVLRHAITNKPRGRKLKEIMGCGKNEKTFDLDVVDGFVAEQAFLNLVTSGKAEVKRDFMVSETRNIAVEISCRGHPSGITTTQAPYWIHWLSGAQYQDEVAVLIATRRLRQIAHTCQCVPGGDDKAARVHLVNVKKLMASNDEIARFEKNRNNNPPRMF